MAAKPFQDPFIKLLGSTARVRLLRLFLFNPKKTFTTKEAASRVRIAAPEVQRELKLLLTVGLLRKSTSTVVRWSADERFAFFEALQQMFLLSPLRSRDIHERIRTAGAVRLIVLSGIFVGNFEGGLDILVVGDKLNEKRLVTALKILEADIGSTLQYSSLSVQDFMYRLTISDRFIRDIFDYPHRIAFDRLDIGLK